MLVAVEVLAPQQLQLVPDRVGKPHLGERVGSLGAGVRIGREMHERTGLERLEDGGGERRLVQGTLAQVRGRERRHFPQARQIDDLAARGDQRAVRRMKIPSQDGAGQRELAHGDASSG